MTDRIPAAPALILNWQPAETAPKNGTPVFGRVTDTYRWKPYKPDGRRQMGVPGRWQVLKNEYFKWENCPAPDEWAPQSLTAPKSDGQRLLPCPICDGEAINHIDILKRTHIAPETKSDAGVEGHANAGERRCEETVLGNRPAVGRLSSSPNTKTGRASEAGVEPGPSDPIPSPQPLREQVADDWRDDPSSDERWNAGLDYGMQHYCKVLGVDPQNVRWDAATETLDGDVCAVISNILDKAFGENWAAKAPAQPAPISGLEPVAWRPIKTAPRDGTPILCFTPGYQSTEFSDQSGIDVLWFDGGAWLYNAEPVTFQPTHWMPLPASPNSASSGYYTLAQLEAHAAEQVRPLVEAAAGTSFKCDTFREG